MMLGQDAERRRLKQHDQTTSTTPSQSNYYKHTNPSPYLKPYPSFCYPNLPSRESQSEPCHPKLLHRPVASIHPALLPSLRSPRDRNTHACLRKPSPVPHRRRAACLPHTRTNQLGGTRGETRRKGGCRCRENRKCRRVRRKC
jgi:hypothetical protein